MDALFAIGSNGSGQLGIGHKEDVSVPKQVQFEPSSPIVEVAAGGNHTLLLTQSGQLYWSGDPASGACGIASEPSVPSFQEVCLSTDPERQTGHIDSIAATWEASFVVARDHDDKRTKLFSFGSGMKGELGSGELIVRTPTATQFTDFPPAGTEIADLTAGMGHAVAVLNNGDAYGWGNCRKSQIGDPGAVVYSPRKIDGIGFKVSRAVCAKESTCFFGEPESGNIRVLGSDKWGLSSNAPATAPPWIDVGASWGDIYILRKDGYLQGWGRDDHGQLPPPNLPRLNKIAIGSEHAVALSADGEVLAWGWGEHGNCGPQVENNDVKGRWNVIASPKFIPPGFQIDRIGAGCATSWVRITGS
ncbi:RCC1 repeat-containing protein C10F6.04 [Tolypocladium ophioglossoides CBS 100239]|uniref:RCC1 repeat-containing protein C10F6.04 n=1 Tax=Tolypocladium ophioglossoides (strain CBS 100239) TaxID=1163406 RepID=A0A0L0N9V9_TOLOC|nr:RCC1 repeat-containing protein C10F6.04 [Tolypocladium ophioglossoides CBS 100239]